MSKYVDIAKNVVHLIGGEKNISHMEHCSTRLRFSLRDNSKVQLEALKKVPGVMSVITGVQLQVVIGNEVVEVYQEVEKIVGVISQRAVSSDKQGFGTRFLDFLIGVFQPLVPAIAGGGVLKSLLVLFSVLEWLDNTSHTYRILTMIGDAPLYFLPLLVAITTANKLKVNPLVALSTVGVMLLPAMSTILAIEGGASLFGYTLQKIDYAYQVFPAILTVLLYAQIETFFTKFTPKALRIFLVPLMSMVITAPIALMLLAPLGYNLGTYLAAFILYLYDLLGWIAVGLLAGVLPFMVVTGMHKAMLPYAISTYSSLGKEILYLPASLAHNISESGAAFAVALKTKDKNLRATAISAGISSFCGITEPALYGVTFLYKKVLYSVVISSVISGLYIGINLVEAFALVGPGFPSMSMFISETASQNIIQAFIGFALALMISFVVTYILFNDKPFESVLDNNPTSTTAVENTVNELTQPIYSPVNGQVVELSSVNDKVFASKVMGDGVAFIPTEGKIYAPTSGEVALFNGTKHALGIKTNYGVEWLIHIGIDTVRLNGEYFNLCVTQGQQVNTGDLLCEFDFNKIKDAGYDVTTMLIATDGVKRVQDISLIAVKSGDVVGTILL